MLVLPKASSSPPSYPPPDSFLTSRVPFRPPPSSGLGSLQSQLYLRTCSAATNMGWLPIRLYFSSLAPTSSKSLLLPLASRGIQANTSAGLTVPSESLISHLLWLDIHPSLRWGSMLLLGQPPPGVEGGSTMRSVQSHLRNQWHLH